MKCSSRTLGWPEKTLRREAENCPVIGGIQRQPNENTTGLSPARKLHRNSRSTNASAYRTRVFAVANTKSNFQVEQKFTVSGKSARIGRMDSSGNVSLASTRVVNASATRIEISAVPHSGDTKWLLDSRLPFGFFLFPQSTWSLQV
jgi:hypothetical protein